GALIAIAPLARAARDADFGVNRRLVEVDAVGVDELLRVLHFATEPDGHHGLLLVVAAAVFLDRPGEAKERFVVRHPRDLDADHPGREECGKNVPPGTRAGEARDADARCGKALRDVSRHVDAYE